MFIIIPFNKQLSLFPLNPPVRDDHIFCTVTDLLDRRRLQLVIVMLTLYTLSFA
jgi:hypothetical protein